MRYVTDANVSGLAKELREKGIDCQTIHMLIKGTEDSRIPIRDPEIVKFLRAQKGTITLITLDSELSEYCANDGIPCIRIQDLVGNTSAGQKLFECHTSTVPLSESAQWAFFAEH